MREWIMGKGDYVVITKSHPLAGSICQITDASNPNYIRVRLWIPCEKLPIWETVETLPAYHVVEHWDIQEYTGDITKLEAEICLRRM